MQEGLYLELSKQTTIFEVKGEHDGTFVAANEIIQFSTTEKLPVTRRTRWLQRLMVKTFRERETFWTKIEIPTSIGFMLPAPPTPSRRAISMDILKARHNEVHIGTRRSLRELPPVVESAAQPLKDRSQMAKHSTEQTKSHSSSYLQRALVTAAHYAPTTVHDQHSERRWEALLHVANPARQSFDSIGKESEDQ